MKSFGDWVKESNPGNYVSIDVENIPTQFVQALPGIINSKPHITLMYSKDSGVPFDHVSYVLKRYNLQGVEIPIVGVDVFDSQVENAVEPLGCIVLKVKDERLNAIHQMLLSFGAKHSYAEFEPHVTLIYDCPIDQCKLAAADIEKKIRDAGLFVRCTTYNNEPVKSDWAKTLK